MKLVKNENNKELRKKVSDKEAEEAFVKILEWMGEDPTLKSNKNYLPSIEKIKTFFEIRLWENLPLTQRKVYT